MQVYTADVSEVLYGQRRDEETIADIEQRLSRLLLHALGQSRWMRVLPHLNSVASAVYYSATLLTGAQTLGEEYVHVWESVFPHPSPPSWLTRLSFVLLHSCAPIAIDRLLARTERALSHQSTKTFLGVDIGTNQVARDSFQAIVRWMRSANVHVQRVHLAVFYITGTYYQLCRRVLGIRFLSTNPRSDVKALRLYRILGYLSLLHMASSVLLWVYAISKEEPRNVNEENVVSKKQVVSSFSCGLCMENSPPSALFCGHIFCWDCLLSIAQRDVSAKCPQCRRPFEPQQVIPLVNL